MTSSRPFLANILMVWAIALVISTAATTATAGSNKRHLTANRNADSRAAAAGPDNELVSSSLTRTRREAAGGDLLSDDDTKAFEAEMKRFGAYRLDTAGKQKLAFRSDLGRKRATQAIGRYYPAFRTDFGKRVQPSKTSVEIAAKENWKRYNSFRSDLGKRFSSFRSDLGKRNDEQHETSNEDERELTTGDDDDDVELDKVDLPSDNVEGGADVKRFASFRSDLGKRRGGGVNLAFRSDLGK